MTILTQILLLPLAPDGTPIATTYRARLVNATGERVKAINIENGSPVISRLTGAFDPAATPDGTLFSLIPQTQLATTPTAVQTWWELTLRAGDETQVWNLSIPESAVPLDLRTLIAAAVGGADFAAELVARVAALEDNQLPPPGTPGRVLLDNGTEWVASDTLPIEDPAA